MKTSAITKPPSFCFTHLQRLGLDVFSIAENDRVFSPTCDDQVTGDWVESPQVAYKAESVERGGVGCVCVCAHFMHSRNHVTIDPRMPTHTGTEHFGSSLIRQTSRAPSANHREVFGKSHEGLVASD